MLERRDAALDESAVTGVLLVADEPDVLVSDVLFLETNLPCKSRLRFLCVNCASVPCYFNA